MGLSAGTWFGIIIACILLSTSIFIILVLRRKSTSGDKDAIECLQEQSQSIPNLGAEDKGKPRELSVINTPAVKGQHKGTAQEKLDIVNAIYREHPSYFVASEADKDKYGTNSIFFAREPYEGGPPPGMDVEEYSEFFVKGFVPEIYPANEVKSIYRKAGGSRVASSQNIEPTQV